MTTAAALLVRIGADVEDFTRGMTKVEKAAQRGFNAISDAAKQMSELITLPVAAAAVEFAKLAGDAQDASARMDRVFGGASAEMKQKLEELTNVIPETVAGMQTLAVQADNMLQGLGYGAGKAASMSVEMVKLAGDMAAFAHMPIGDALDALDRGLAGKTRGLIQFGIVVNQAAIHQEAMRRGLVDEHRTLTELGTAEIAHSLILKAATRIQGEAARTAGQASNSFKFLKVAVEEMGVSIGRLTIPAVVGLTKKLTELSDAAEHASDTKKEIALWGTAVVAAIGPAILLATRFAKEAVALGGAMRLITALPSVGARLAAIPAALAGMSAAPLLSIAAALGLIATAGVSAYKITQNIMRGLNGGQLDSEKADDEEQAQKDRVRGALIHHAHSLKSRAVAPPAKTGPLSQDPRSALDIFKEHASLVEDQFQAAADSGAPLVSSMQQINNLHAEAVRLLAAQNGKWTEMAEAAAKAIRKTQEIKDTVAVASAMANGSATPEMVHAAALRKTTTTEMGLNAAKGVIDADSALSARESALRMADTFNATREATVAMGEQMRNAKHDLDTRSAALALDDGFDAARTALVQMGEQTRKTKEDLNLRAALLNLKDGFDAAKTAAVELGERIRKAKEDFATAAASFKDQWGGKNNIASSAMAGLADGAAQALASFSPMALAAQGVAAIMQGLQPVLNALFVPLEAFGKIIGIIAGPILKPWFESLKGLGIAAALVGEVLYTVAGGIAKVVGGLISAIGAFIRKIPFLGGIGKDIQNFGDNIQNLGKSFFKTADDLDTARRQLQDLSFEDAMNGVTAAANATASAMLNVPTGVKGFNAALEQFNALTPKGPISPTGPASYVTASAPGASQGDLTVNVVMPDGSVLTNVVLKDFKRRAQARFGDSTRWTEVMS